MPISTTSSKYLLLKEVEKCILVCCRCHREIHAGMTYERQIKRLADTQTAPFKA